MEGRRTQQRVIRMHQRARWRSVQDILQGLERPDHTMVIADRTAAIRAALAKAQPGDCVLVAGKGHENYQLIGRDRIPLDDREIARYWLYEMKPHGVGSC